MPENRDIAAVRLHHDRPVEVALFTAHEDIEETPAIDVARRRSPGGLENRRHDVDVLPNPFTTIARWNHPGPAGEER